MRERDSLTEPKSEFKQVTDKTLFPIKEFSTYTNFPVNRLKTCILNSQNFCLKIF